jgi:23S rRNA (cytosine1962-C5)-methyltransferase
LDQYAGTLVLKLYSVIWFQRIEEIVGLLREEFLPERMVLRLSRNIHEKAAALGFSDPAVLFGSEPDGPVIFRESGLLFEADVLKGQKTGFFLDQRENRRRVGGLSQGKDVLNAFSFSGGFSMYAALAGARSVTDVDISRHALESSRRNFALNGNRAAISRHLLIQADVFKWIEDDRAERYDVIVVDPPSLAKRESERSRSLKAYANLAGSGLKLLRSGGTIVCCSCSAHVGAVEFFQTIETVAERSGRKFKVLHTAREPADHPAAFAEAEYLKAIYLRFE